MSVEITYKSIKGLLVDERMEKGKMFCVFEVEGERFEADAGIKRDMSKTGERVKSIVKMNMISRMRSSFNRILRGVLGGGMAGNIGSQVGNAVVSEKSREMVYSKADKEGAVVAAFKRIAFNFNFEEGKWTIARKLSEFEKRIRKTPLTAPYDKKTLARLLIEMAKADGSIAKEEKEFFQDFLNEDTGSFSELMRTPPVTAVDCQEVSKEAKENVYMITVAVALADREFDDSEKAKLDEYAEMFGFRPHEKEELIRFAQDYTVETAILSSGTELNLDELYEFADNIGMPRAEAQRAQIRLSKRLNV
ncbi:MAG: TerB family tellurite resistance protein [Saprospiraceae bacterium]|nr:TerB family tellurite resistance protein [Saprospiraceae bacterium]